MTLQTDPQPHVRNEAAELRRERTISAAVDLFYQNGYANTTLDEVALSLGVTKPFIYANFVSKAELLAEICARGVQIATEAIDDVLAQDLDARAAMEAFTRNYVEATLVSQKHIAVYFREEKMLQASDLAHIGEMRRSLLAKITGFLERGAAEGEFDLEDAGLAALGIVGAVSWSAFWYSPEGRLSRAEIADGITALVLRLAGAKGTRVPG